uniref:RING-type domain-containing protein n=1 Tax=Globisporangium ultimum (strain ATCC 200006 / CBS 805.95 / DAOM BR144) TaxID=431595 RepID=K3WWX4_GLOUD
MDITVRVEVQYVAPEHALISDVLQMFRTPSWVRFMVRYISPHLKNAAPADTSVVESLASWKVLTNANDPAAQHSSCAASPCVICMSDFSAQEKDAVQLPCGHCFHHGCIQSWLKLRSTCPTCRFQFRKAFSGSYAVKTLNSALLLKPEHRYLTKDDILKTCVGKETVRAVVNVTLSQIASQTKRSQYPCVLNALMMHSNGESFTEVAPIDKSSMDNTVAAAAAGSRAAAAARHVRSADEMCASSDSSSSSSSGYEHDDKCRTKRVRVN